MIAAVIFTDRSPSEARKPRLLRLGGTVLGAALGAGLSPSLAHHAWAIEVGIMAMSPTHLLRLQAPRKLTGYLYRPARLQ